VARLTPSAEAVAEHEAQRGFEHRFVRLLKASLFVEGEDLMGFRRATMAMCESAESYSSQMRPLSSEFWICL
jgi:hypothetical protein